MLRPGERRALRRLRDAALAIVEGHGRYKRLRAALEARPSGHADAELVWATCAIVSGVAARRTPQFLELDAAFEALFREVSGAIGPTVRLWGSSTGATTAAGTAARRGPGRPPRVREPEHARA